MLSTAPPRAAPYGPIQRKGILGCGGHCGLCDGRCHAGAWLPCRLVERASSALDAAYLWLGTLGVPVRPTSTSRLIRGSAGSFYQGLAVWNRCRSSRLASGSRKRWGSRISGTLRTSRSRAGATNGNKDLWCGLAWLGGRFRTWRDTVVARNWCHDQLVWVVGSARQCHHHPQVHCARRPKGLACERARRIVRGGVPPNPSTATLRRVGRLLFADITIRWAVAADPLLMH